MNLHNTSSLKMPSQKTMFFLYKHCNTYSDGSTNIVDYQAEHFLISRQTFLCKLRRLYLPDLFFLNQLNKFICKT